MSNTRFVSLMRLFIVVVFFAQVACSGDLKRQQNAEIEALQKDTETIHDDAMKDMASMNRYARALKAQLNEPNLVGSRKTQILDTLTLIQKAEDGMYTWMKNYQAPSKEMKPEAAKAYLLAQKALIEVNAQEIKVLVEPQK
jgi:beta-phosphoglucomutase-like phosphatase (HAD superfamily)